jgi:SulP family sulfate permease
VINKKLLDKQSVRYSSAVLIGVPPGIYKYLTQMLKPRQLVSNSLAGILMAVINITVAVSEAVLMFSGTTPQFLAVGIVALLMSMLIIGSGGTLFSGFGGVICSPRSALAPVFATIISSVYVTLHSEPDSQLPTVLMAIMVTSIVTGIFLLLLGRFRLGNLVRYIPYPVMAGFFAGIGFLFVKGGLEVAIGQAPSLDMINDPHLVQLALSAIIFAVVLYAGLNKFDHWSVFPMILAIGLAVFYGWFYQSGQTLVNAIETGWLPQIGTLPELSIPVFSAADLSLVNWAAISPQAGHILVAALLSAIILLLDVSGIEIITKKDLNPDKELNIMGMASIASGILGGYPGVHVASDTAFTSKLGGNTRLMGFVYAGVVILALLAGTDFISKVPTFILGGLLLYVGFDFLIDWTWKIRSELPVADYLIVIMILAAIALVDILQGVAFGFAVAAVLFVINYSRLSVIKSEATGRDRASNVDRDLETREKLNEQGDRILILILQGFIFFGTSDKLITEIKECIEDKSRTKPDFLVLNFCHVNQLDASAVKAFSKLAQLSERYSVHVLITGAKNTYIQHLNSIGFMTGDTGQVHRMEFVQLDDGIAWCEKQILDELNRDTGGMDRNFYNLLTRFLGDEAAARELAPYFTEERRRQGECLFHQGDVGDSLYLVVEGSAAVVIGENENRWVLRRYKSGAILGEMALYSGELRSASVEIEEDSILYRLDAKQFRNMQTEHAEAIGKLHIYIVRLLSERMRRANRELQRLI